MQPLSVVKHFDILKGRRRHLLARCKAQAMHSLILEAVEPALGRRIAPRGQAPRSQQFPLRLIEQIMPYSASLSWNAWLAYWLPRSEWCITPGAGFLRNHAIVSASVTMDVAASRNVSAVMRGLSDQPPPRG